MKIRAVCALAAALAFCTTVAADASGMTLIEQSDPTAQLVGTQVVLQAGLDRQTARQNGLAALVAESILQTRVDGVHSLEEAVRDTGASLRYAIDARDVRFYLEGVNRSYPVALGLFRAALGKPDFGAETLNVARTALEAKIARLQLSPLNVAIDMLNRSFYSDSAGMPPYGLPETLAGFTSADAQGFYRMHYLAGDAVVSIVGNVAGLGQSAFAGVVAGLPQRTSPKAVTTAVKLSSKTRELLAHRDISVPWLVAQYAAPDVGSKDFGAMLILSAFMQRTLADVSAAPTIATRSAAQRGVGAFYNFDAYPANVILYVDGGLGDPTRTFATALTVVNVLGHAKISGNLSDLKSYAIGRLLQDTTTLQDRAWFAAVYSLHGVHGDYMRRAIKAINITTAGQLQRVAARYLGMPTIALVLPRSASGQSHSP